MLPPLLSAGIFLPHFNHSAGNPENMRLSLALSHWCSNALRMAFVLHFEPADLKPASNKGSDQAELAIH